MSTCWMVGLYVAGLVVEILGLLLMSHRFPRRSLGLALFFALTSAAPTIAQGPVRIEGRIVEAGTDFGLASGSVRLGGGPETLADVEGHFRIEGVQPGRHVLTVRAYGYRMREVRLLVRADTTIVVQLEPAPVPIDSLVVEGRTVTVRGEVREGDTGRRLKDAEVRLDRREPAWTGGTGRFKIEDVAAGPPFQLSVRAFGYMPVRTVVSALRDTTLLFELEPDPVAQRMIRRQVARLEERAHPFVSAVMPAMNREDLLRRGIGTALDVVRHRYGPMLRRVSCLLIDDRQRYNGLEELVTYLPEDLERIEVLNPPGGYMLRIYTRDYIRKMMAEGVELARPLYVGYTDPPYCR